MTGDYAYSMCTCSMSSCGRIVDLIWLSFNDGVAEHEAGVSPALVRLESHDQHGRATGKSVRRRLVTADRRRQRHVRVSVEQLDSVGRAVRWRFDWHSMNVHVEHLPDDTDHTRTTSFSARITTQPSYWAALRLLPVRLPVRLSHKGSLLGSLLTGE